MVVADCLQNSGEESKYEERSLRYTKIILSYQYHINIIIISYYHPMNWRAPRISEVVMQKARADIEPGGR